MSGAFGVLPRQISASVGFEWGRDLRIADKMQDFTHGSLVT